MKYRINGREVTKEEWDAHKPTQPCDYSKGECPVLRMGDDNWSSENNGKGRYISQLAQRPNDPKAYCKSKAEVKDTALRRGFTVEAAT
jgi:hypothetical protein